MQYITRNSTWALQPITLTVAMLCHSAMAADASTSAKEHQLQTVEVSATGLGLDAAEMAAPVSVLDGEVWQQRRSATLGGSLDGEPGIHATHFGAGASRPVIRGMDGPRVGVLANGMELHDASTLSPDHAVVTEPLLARQVEILRGPAALVHGGAVGGVVNVVDDRIPSARPDKAVEGHAEVKWGGAANARSAAMGLTTGSGPLVLRVQAAGHHAGDYRVGGKWRSEDGRRKVPGSWSDGHTGSLGLSWVGEHGYLGAAYTRQRAEYGLPGHAHSDCHPHGSHLHCGGHGDEHDDHEHEHDAHDHRVPEVDLTSHRWDLRGEWRNPVAGIEAVRLKGSHTRYMHDEVEEGAVATSFRNRAHDLRVDVQHAPIAGWHGVLGVSNGQRHFRADGKEAYVQPTRTHRSSFFVLEEYPLGDWRLQAALRHDWQEVRLQQSAQTRRHHGTSLSLGTVWKFAPGWQASASFSHAARLPSAEELFANGLHMATNSWEVGNSQLRKETSRAWDLGVRKLAGSTTWSANVFHYRIHDYIYARTVDVHDGFRLQHYTQADARLHGLEAQLRQRLNRFAGLSVFGDAVRGKLAAGGNLPRIPAARLGVRADVSYQGWEGMLEWVQTARQKRTAALEMPTAGYGMLNLSFSYRLPGTPLQLFVKAENLNNRLAYSHASVIKREAPRMGRNIMLGLSAQF